MTPTQNVVPNGVSSGRNPPEGPRAIKVTVDFSQGSTQTIDVRQVLQQHHMTCVQAAFVSNYLNAQAVTIRADNMGQSQTLSAGAQGWLSLLSPDFDTLTVTCSAGVKVDFFLLNFPVDPFVWGASGGVTPGVYVQIAGDTMTGPLQVPSGSLAAPGIQVGELNSGIRLVSAGYLEIVTGGIEGLIVRDADPTNQQTIGSNRTGTLAICWRSDTNQVNRHEQYTNSAAGPTYNIRKARGTFAASTVINTNDQIGTLAFQGYTGAAFANAATIVVTCTAAAPGPGVMQGRMTINIAGASGAAVEVVRIEQTVGLSMYGANVVIDNNRLLKHRVYTVGTLPSAVTAGAGAAAYVSDANAPVFGAAVAGGGAAKVTVYSDGAAWLVG